MLYMPIFCVILRITEWVKCKILNVKKQVVHIVTDVVQMVK
jgi:hypothetical protein